MNLTLLLAIASLESALAYRAARVPAKGQSFEDFARSVLKGGV
jgi:hypothetical protein